MPEPRRPRPLQVLLDENVDRLLKPHFHSNYNVVTVTELGWAGASDKELLRRAETRCARVTMDQNLPYQQHLPEYEVAVVVLKAPTNAFSDVVELMPEANEEISRAKSGEVRIRRRDGSEYIIRPRQREKSPLDVPPLSTEVSAEEIVAAVREGRERPAP